MRHAVLIALALVTTTVGCGESKEENFDKDYRSVNDQIAELRNDVNRAALSAKEQSNLEIERQFGGYAERMGSLQQDVDELEAPNELEGQQEDLIAAMGDAQDALEDIERAADDNDGRAARTAGRELGVALRELGRARRKLARSTGVTVGD